MIDIPYWFILCVSKSYLQEKNYQQALQELSQISFHKLYYRYIPKFVLLKLLIYTQIMINAIN